MAISILLLLAVVAAGVTQWMGAAHEEVAAEVTSQRALSAARSGLQWGRGQVVQASPAACFSDTSMALDRGNGCEVEMACSSVDVAGESPATFALKATGTCPFRGDVIVERTLQMRVRP
ncbi:MAG: hypothetical protein ACQERG_08635 [Pseudomonadota bacterium]